MKRSKPLTRKTPLARSAFAPGQRSALKRSAPVKRSAPRKSGAMDGTLREAVIARSRGACDLCGRRADPGAMHAHHRKLRTRGGPDSLANLVGLHPECHGWVHGNPAAATELGFMISSWNDAADTPLMLHRARWVLAEQEWKTHE